MYREFNLKIPSDLNQSSLETGKLILKKNNDIVKSTLDKFMPPSSPRLQRVPTFKLKTKRSVCNAI
jgi:hypothetical protein